MAITVTTARSRSRGDFLDDDGTRWSDTECDRALQFALSSVFDEYLRAGGDRFIQTVTGTTDTAGLLSLSSYTPAQIYGVAIKNGTAYFPIRYLNVRERGADSASARGLSIELARTPSVGTSAQPLVSDGAGAALNTWDDFDELVCARAAQSMAIKDGRGIGSLDNHVARLSESVMRRPVVPRAREMPMIRKNPYEALFHWYYDSPTKSLQILRRVLL